MKYLVKAEVLDGTVHTYTTEAEHSAEAMSEAYDKFGVCAVMVAPAPEGVPSSAAILALLADCKQKLQLYRNGHSGEYVGGVELSALMKRIDSTCDAITAPACPVDTAIANLDALLAERRASTMDHAQLAALGKEAGDADLDAADHALGEVGKALADAGYDEPDKSLAGSIRALAAERDSLRAALTAREAS